MWFDNLLLADPLVASPIRFRPQSSIGTRKPSTLEEVPRNRDLFVRTELPGEM